MGVVMSKWANRIETFLMARTNIDLRNAMTTCTSEMKKQTQGLSEMPLANAGDQQGHRIFSARSLSLALMICCLFFVANSAIAAIEPASCGDCHTYPLTDGARGTSTGAVVGMLVGLTSTLVYIFMFKGWLFIPGTNNFPDTSEYWLFGIQPEAFGAVGALLNFTFAWVVSKMTAPPPEHIQHLVEDIRVPRSTANAA